MKRAGQSVAPGRRIGRLARVESKKIEEGTVGFRIALFIRTTLAEDPLRSHDSTNTLDYFDGHARDALERKPRVVRVREARDGVAHESFSRKKKSQMLCEMNRENTSTIALDSSWKRKIKSYFLLFVRDNFPSICSKRILSRPILSY